MKFIKLVTFYLTYLILIWLLFALLRILPLWILRQLGWSFSLPAILAGPLRLAIAYGSVYILLLYLDFKFALETPYVTRWTISGAIAFFVFLILFIVLPVGFLFLLEFIFGAQAFGDFIRKDLWAGVTWFFTSTVVMATQMPLRIIKAYGIMD